MIGRLLAIAHQIKDTSGNILGEEFFNRWTDDKPAASIGQIVKEWGL